MKACTLAVVEGVEVGHSMALDMGLGMGERVLMLTIEHKLVGMGVQLVLAYRVVQLVPLVPLVPLAPSIQELRWGLANHSILEFRVALGVLVILGVLGLVGVGMA